MKTRPVHQNLDTSFVNLSALLRHLRQQKFVGVVHLEMKDYEADIFLTKDNKLESRENDRLAGRVSAGDDVLKRLLIRAGSPGGIINVYQTIDEPKPIIKKPVPGYERKAAEVNAAAEINPPPAPPTPAQIPADVLEISQASLPENEKTGAGAKIISLKEKLGLPSLPFSFTNKFEKKARQQKAVAPVEDWNELLDLMSEILQTVEICLAQEKLNFDWVFDKVRVEIYKDYPFLKPGSETFEYKDGRVLMSEQINKNLFTMSILESLKCILAKFEAHPKFAGVYQATVESLRELLERRQSKYDKFKITSPLRRIIH